MGLLKLLNNKAKEDVVEHIIMANDNDATGWMVDGSIADFLLFKTNAIKYMCMFGYAFMAANKVFTAVPANTSVSYKFVNCILATVGGGILVPIFTNNIPVPLAQDAYMVAIISAFMLHHYFPILRDVLKQSALVKICFIIMFETIRALVVVLQTNAGRAAIKPSQFAFAIFGPIMCGTVGGCGSAFMPLSKGLEPLKYGMTPPVMSALVGATCYHLYLSTSLSDGVVDAPKKAQFHLALFFITVGLSTAFGFGAATTTKVEVSPKKKN